MPTYTHADIHTCRHTHMPTYAHADIHTCRHTHMPTYTHADILTCRHTHMPTYAHADIHTCRRQAGWQVVGNHLYENCDHAIYANACFATTIGDNYIEDFGHSGCPGAGGDSGNGADENTYGARFGATICLLEATRCPREVSRRKCGWCPLLNATSV
jgi:hypothetical protein